MTDRQIKPYVRIPRPMQPPEELRPADVPPWFCFEDSSFEWIRDEAEAHPDNGQTRDPVEQRLRQPHPEIVTLKNWKAVVSICPAGHEAWLIQYTHELSPEASLTGRFVISKDELRAAFGIDPCKDTAEPLPLSPLDDHLFGRLGVNLETETAREGRDCPALQQFLQEECGADAAKPHYYVRARRYLNIPGPGTGLPGDVMISLLITPAITEAVTGLLNLKEW